ncbi:A-kinase anchor protein 4 [Lemmus lemmus]
MGASKNTNNNESPSNPAAKSPNNQRLVATPDGECSMDDVSFYVNQLASLVIQMARKEIRNKLEGGSKCIHRSIYAPTGEKQKANPRRAVSKIASEMAHEAVEMTSAEMHGTGEECRDGGQKTFLYSELSNKNKCGEKQMCPKDSKEFADSIRRGSWFMQIRNLFNHGKQNAADIMEAMLKCLVSALLGEKKETKSQSLAYATYKAGTHDPKCKNQSLEFSAMKGEMKGKHKCKVKTDLCCKSLTSTEKICFVDVSTLNVEDKDSKGADGSSSEGKLNLENLEEKEIIVIKDTEKQDQSKRVLLKHTKEIVSDLIDSCMKNVHNITGDLKTDSDFVSAVKRNLFNHGKQNTADIMEAMLKCLVSALLGEKKETKSQSLAYATYKAGTHDPKCKNQSLEFSAMKGEMKGKDKCKVKTDLCCKSLTSAEKLTEVSAKAAGKGYCVGDLLLEVMKFAKERQLDEAIGNMARKQLLDWLLANL